MELEYNATIKAQVLVITMMFFKEFMILNPFDYQVLLQKYLTKMTKKRNNTKRYLSNNNKKGGQSGFH